MGNRIRSRKEDSGPTQRGATVCVSVRASLCVPSKLQMRLTPCVLLQGTKSQNIGHTRMSLFISVSSEAYSNPRVFQHLCVCVCSSIVCAALICAIGSKFGPTLLPHLMHSGSYGMNISFFFLSLMQSSVSFPSRGLNQSGCTLVKILARSWPRCWHSTLPHRVRVL